jgi:formimidoylglutamate deiminase
LRSIEPDQLYDIARQLYLEMLRAGYTSVAEFQYLHHDRNGRPYDNRAEMTLQCRQAAQDVGIGFSALPVLYHAGGFGGQAPGDGQKRFINDVDQYCEIVTALLRVTAARPDQSTGLAPHSLRAVTRETLQQTIDLLQGEELASFHIHIAEQVKEVQDCLDWSGMRPVEWLLRHFDVDERWCLVHATHMTRAETRDVAASGAVVGLCPTTEANLGDGFFNVLEYRAAGGRWGIGSDSQISVSPVEELRWLEYGARLVGKSRNLHATETLANTGAALLQEALAGSAGLMGCDVGSIGPGNRADLVVLDQDHPRLYGRSGHDLLDSWIFSGNEPMVKDVYLGGERVITDGVHRHEQEIGQRFRLALDRLSA